MSYGDSVEESMSSLVYIGMTMIFNVDEPLVYCYRCKHGFFQKIVRNREYQINT
ncbi:MAG: hypothetical protein V1870_01835 [Candidatus Aenigmatarchaeota archaeon]